MLYKNIKLTLFVSVLAIGLLSVQSVLAVGISVGYPRPITLSNGQNLYYGAADLQGSTGGNLLLLQVDDGVDLIPIFEVGLDGSVKINGNEVCTEDGCVSSSAGDNLGDHTATANISLNGFRLSNDGGTEGISIDNSGNVSASGELNTQWLHVNGTGESTIADYLTIGTPGQVPGNLAYSLYAYGNKPFGAFLRGGNVGVYGLGADTGGSFLSTNSAARKNSWADLGWVDPAKPYGAGGVYGRTTGGLGVYGHNTSATAGFGGYFEGRLYADEICLGSESNCETDWAVAGSGDNLGNHTATTNLNMSGNRVNSVDRIQFQLNGGLQGVSAVETVNADSDLAVYSQRDLYLIMDEQPYDGVAGDLIITKDSPNDPSMLIVKNNGNVGIGTGTTDPTEKLEVVGNIKSSGDIISTAANAQVAVSQNFAFRDTGTTWLYLRNGAGSNTYADLALSRLWVSGALFAQNQILNNSDDVLINDWVDVRYGMHNDGSQAGGALWLNDTVVMDNGANDGGLTVGDADDPNKWPVQGYSGQTMSGTTLSIRNNTGRARLMITAEDPNNSHAAIIGMVNQSAPADSRIFYMTHNNNGVLGMGSSLDSNGNGNKQFLAFNLPGNTINFGAGGALVGIGNPTPNARLDVNGSAVFTSNNATGGGNVEIESYYGAANNSGGGIRFNEYYDPNNNIMRHTRTGPSGTIEMKGEFGDWSFTTAPSGSEGSSAHTNRVTGLTVKNNGQVGVRTTGGNWNDGTKMLDAALTVWKPGAGSTIDLYGTGSWTETTGIYDYSGIRFFDNIMTNNNSSFTGQHWGIWHKTGRGAFDDHQMNFNFYDGSAYRNVMALKVVGTQGRVAINKQVPSYPLDVNGSIRVNSTVYSSDKRLKENISPLTSSLSKVLGLSGVSYNWKASANMEDDSRQIGLIAQDVEKLVPEVVSTDEKGYKSVDYAKLVPVLIEAIKDQQSQISDLQSQINNLK